MPNPKPNPSVDYIFNNDRRRNHFAIFVAIVIALICGAACLATLPDDSAGDMPITQPTEGR